MAAKNKVLLLPGDGIGPEIVGAAEGVLRSVANLCGVSLEIEKANLGGCAIDQEGKAYPGSTAKLANAADAILLGAVGGPKWDGLESADKPEKGLLAIRADLDLFANLRPAILFDALAGASSLKAELVAGLDVLIVRELTGGIYFGRPRGIRVHDDSKRSGFNTLVYHEDEIRRIARVAFALASKRSGKLCSIDKANVLEVSELWREVVEEEARAFPEVSLSHMYVDNAAMQLVCAPKQFDVLLTPNLFGDILSDQAAMLTGSIGMLPSASLNADQKGLFEPCHGSAPDIAGRGIANPLATILSLAMMFKYSLEMPKAAELIEAGVN